MTAYVGAVGAALALVLTAAPPAAFARVPGSLDPSRIEGTITVIMNATRVKHWGVPGADAAFVPDTDRTTYAARIRAASSASALCAALHTATGGDSSIASTSIDGDGSFEHRSGDVELMTFALVVDDPAATVHGSLYVCTHPAFATMSRGAYPDEQFYRASADHVHEWKNGPLTLHPGESLPVRLVWSIDASRW
jgi:hypothetical protein